MRTDLRGIGMTSQRTRDRLVDALAAEGIADARVLDVLRACPRHIFVDEALSHRAYENTALPIGHDQTISQPYIVARMTELLLSGGRPDRVLEVGSGSGYQTAVLAGLCQEVYSVERIRALQDLARSRLRLLGVRNVRLRWSDGGEGWPEKGPFDGILVTAAPRQLPATLLEQLAVGGRMVVPVGEDTQWLTLVRRTPDGVDVQRLEPVRFVPFLSNVTR